MSRPLLHRAGCAALTLLALCAPLLLAVELVRAAGAPGEQLAAGLLPGGLLLRHTPTIAERSARDAAAPEPGTGTLGVLYTRGEARITWNDREFPVADGSYAYAGGETVRMRPQAVGMLRLAGGGTVYLCGGSTARLNRDHGGFALELLSGTSRLRLPPDSTPIEVLGSGVRMRSITDRRLEVEIEHREDGGWVVYELAGTVRVRAAGAGEVPAAGAVGRVIEVSPRGDGGHAVRTAPLPGAAVEAAARAGETPARLCRAGELLGAADAAQPAQAAASPAATDQELPPVAPPDLAPVALAEPAPPDPFDPNVLPPPAAGEPAAPVVVVAPPAVPVFGAGGGGGGSSGVAAGGGEEASPS